MNNKNNLDQIKALHSADVVLTILKDLKQNIEKYNTLQIQEELAMTQAHAQHVYAYLQGMKQPTIPPANELVAAYPLRATEGIEIKIEYVNKEEKK